MLKQLRDNKAQLVRSAAAKLALITDQTSAEDARKIEGEHNDLLAQIRIVDELITRAEKDERDFPKKKRKARDGGSDEDDENDDEDDDDDDEDDKKKKRKARKGGCDDEGDDRTLTNVVFAEMNVIDTQARSLGIDVDLAGAIERNEGPDILRKRMFAELAKKSKKGPEGGDGTGLQLLRDEREGVKESMEIALITRMLQSRGDQAIEYKPKNLRERARVEQYRKQAEQYMPYGLVDIAAACIDYKPNRTGSRYLTAGDASGIFERAFNSTSDFPNIFQNVLNKSLLARYELHMPTYRELAVERPFNDFRPHPQIRAGEFPNLQPVTETGEIKYGTSTDNGETVSVVPYGVIFTISRTMLVNDDLGAIDQILGSAGDTVLIFENTTFFNLLLANPTLVQDSTAVFASGHNNLASPGAAPSITTIGSARQALRQMKSISGNFLNVPARILVAGPIQETTIDQMVTAISPTLTTSVNPFSGRLRAVSDANITDDSWYLFSEPARVPCFMYGFLNGANGPRTRTFEPFGVQGVKISLEHDFGCGAIDFRGAYKSPSF